MLTWSSTNAPGCRSSHPNKKNNVLGPRKDPFLSCPSTCCKDQTDHMQKVTLLCGEEASDHLNSSSSRYASDLLESFLRSHPGKQAFQTKLTVITAPIKPNLTPPKENLIIFGSKRWEALRRKENNEQKWGMKKNGGSQRKHWPAERHTQEQRGTRLGWGSEGRREDEKDRILCSSTIAGVHPQALCRTLRRQNGLQIWTAIKLLNHINDVCCM